MRLGAGQQHERRPRPGAARRARPARAATPGLLAQAGRGRRNWRCAASPGRRSQDAGPRPAGLAPRRARGRPPREAAPASGKCGTRPSAGQPVRSAMSRMPSSNRARIAAEAVDDEARGPSRRRRGRAPPWCRRGSRSRRPGRCRRRAPPACPVARAKPILAMSPARRFTSEAEPAPSTMTRSASARQAPEASSTGVHEPRLPGLVLARLRGADHAALHHHLRADLALRLQQHRVHVHARRHARRPGPGAPGPGRSRRRPPSRRRCSTCSAA